MFIISIIGIVTAGLLMYGFIEWFNRYTSTKGHYRFFTKEHTIAFVASYLMIVFGYRMMEKQWMGDSLNGAFILIIGIVILLLTIRNNFKSTKRSLAIQGSFAQLILYVPITIVAFILIIAAVAFFSQTKPVYSINSRD